MDRCNHCTPSNEVHCTQDILGIRTVHTGRNMEYKTNRTIEQCLLEISLYTMEVLQSQRISNILILDKDDR